MTWRPGTVGLILLAAAAAGAEEPAAPLANSAQELKTLQRDQATKTGGKLTEALPQMQTPLPGVPLPEPAKPPKSEAELKDLKKKKDSQKNWLVDGVDKLGKNSGTKSRGARDTGEAGMAQDDEEQLDSTDPEYILKLYSEQQKEAEAKAGAKQAAPAQADPFAPFLQGWLGSSPARGRFFDESIRKPESSPGAIALGGSPVAGSGQVFSTVETADSSRSTTVVAQPNPYLAGLDLPSLAESGGIRPSAPMNLGPTAKSTETQPAVLPGGGTQPALRASERKPPPSPQAVDDKYFPQLKRF